MVITQVYTSVKSLASAHFRFVYCTLQSFFVWIKIFQILNQKDNILFLSALSQLTSSSKQTQSKRDIPDLSTKLGEFICDCGHNI